MEESKDHIKLSSDKLRNRNFYDELAKYKKTANKDDFHKNELRKIPSNPIDLVKLLDEFNKNKNYLYLILYSELNIISINNKENYLQYSYVFDSFAHYKLNNIVRLRLIMEEFKSIFKDKKINQIDFYKIYCRYSKLLFDKRIYELSLKYANDANEAINNSKGKEDIVKRYKDEINQLINNIQNSIKKENNKNIKKENNDNIKKENNENNSNLENNNKISKNNRMRNVDNNTEDGNCEESETEDQVSDENTSNNKNIMKINKVKVNKTNHRSSLGKKNLPNNYKNKGITTNQTEAKGHQTKIIKSCSQVKNLTIKGKIHSKYGIDNDTTKNFKQNEIESLYTQPNVLISNLNNRKEEEDSKEVRNGLQVTNKSNNHDLTSEEGDNLNKIKESKKSKNGDKSKTNEDKQGRDKKLNQKGETFSREENDNNDITNNTGNKRSLQEDKEKNDVKKEKKGLKRTNKNDDSGKTNKKNIKPGIKGNQDQKGEKQVAAVNNSITSEDNKIKGDQKNNVNGQTLNNPNKNKKSDISINKNTNLDTSTTMMTTNKEVESNKKNNVLNKNVHKDSIDCSQQSDDNISTKEYDISKINMRKDQLKIWIYLSYSYVNDYWINFNILPENKTIIDYFDDTFIWKNLDYIFENFKRLEVHNKIHLLILCEEFKRPYSLRFRDLLLNKEKLSFLEICNLLEGILQYETDNKIAIENFKLYKFVDNSSEDARNQSTFNIILNYLNNIKKLYVNKKTLEQIFFPNDQSTATIKKDSYYIIELSKEEDFFIELIDSDFTSKQKIKEISNLFKLPKSISKGNGIFAFFNQGNTCYFNAGIQCIFHCPLLMNYFLINDYDKLIEINNKKGDRFLEELSNTINYIWTESNMRVNPYKLWKEFVKIEDKYADHDQHDSPEMISDFLNLISQKLSVSYDTKYDINCLDNEFCRHWKSSLNVENSIIKTLFYGQLFHVYECLDCNKKYQNKYEPFLLLNLIVMPDKKESNLYECIKNTFTSKYNGVHEECTAKKRDKGVITKSEISILPPYIIFYFKRFYYYRAKHFWERDGFKKISYKIKYNEKIDLKDYVNKENVHGKTTYHLINVDIHSGIVNFGHYYMLTNVNDEKNWVELNDSSLDEYVDYQSRDALALFYVNEDLKDYY